MKSTKSSFKSLKNIVSKSHADKRLVPNQNFGEIVIPIGSDNLFVELPSLAETSTFSIINADEMTGNITLKTSGGASLKGLMLRSNGGSLSIDPIQTGTDELTLESDVKDGCFIQTLSNGNEWFIWSVATGGTINIRTGGVITTYTPTPPTPVYADITNVVITSDVRFVGGGLEARHDLTFSGQGEPNAFLTISETTGNADAALVFPITIQIASDGTWELNKNTLVTNLPNATYRFNFTPTLGNGVQNQSFTRDTGVINFAVPSTFTPDPAEVVDFSSGASASFPDGTPIAVVVDSSAWNSSLVHGDTFDIIYSITDPAVNGGATVSQTVTGTIVDDTPPAAPVISAASIANINELSANGTAEPNKTITLFQDNLPLSPTVTSDGAGNWSFGPVVLNFNSNFTLKAQASEAGVGNPNRSAFGEYSPAFNYVQPVTPAPTIGVNGEQTSVWTNTANTLTISGTTEVGATIDVLDGANPATLVSGPTVDGSGNWSATINVADESVTSLSAKATLAGHLTSQAASFQLNVDRVAPVITVTGATQTVYLGNIGDGNDQGAIATDFSSATVTSDWSTAVDATEGAKTVTYTATDAAGNTATETRTVNVSTQVIIPVITDVADNGDGTATVEGTVAGTYADNLTVQVLVGGLDDGSPVTVLNGLFSYTTTNLGNGTFAITAITINSVGEESGLSNEETSLITAPTAQFLEDSSSLVINPTYSSDVYYHTDGTLIHDVASGVSSGGVASIPVSLMSSTNTPDSISYSIWFYLDSSSGGQVRILKGTSGGTPSHLNVNGPGIVWHAGGGTPYLREATSGITDGSGLNTHSDGTNANIYYPPAGSNLARSAWHHVIVQHEWDSANTRWLTNVFINGGRATDAAGTEVSDVHVDSGNVSQSILDTTKLNYLVSSKGSQIDSYDVVIDSSASITDAIALEIYNDSTRQTSIEDAIASAPPAASFIEDITSVINRADNTNGYSINSGILTDNNNSTTGALPIHLDSDGIVSYDSSTGETVEDEFTISWWMNLSATGTTIFGRGGSGRRFGFDAGYHSDGRINTARLIYNNGTGNAYKFKSGLNLQTLNTWNHFAIVVSNDSSDMKVRLYVNGVVVSFDGNTFSGSPNPPLGTKLLPDINNETIGFGGSPGGILSGGTSSVQGQFDSMQIAEGVALEASQILWISQDSLRQRTIDGALAAVNIAPTISLNGSSSLFHPLGQSFSDPGATAQDQTDGDLTSSIQTTIVDSLGASVSEINATTPEETYTITYSVTDSGGETASTTREVIVGAVITSANLLVTQTVTLNGSTTLTNGILDLPGATGDYGTIAGSSDYDPSGGITYSAWVNLDTLKSQQGILSNIFSATGWDGFTMQFLTSGTYPNGYVRVACNNGTNDKQINDVPIDSSGNPVSITTGTWHFLAATFNPTGGECIAYFNGIALSQTLSGASIKHNNAWPFYIGAQRDSSTNYTVDGQIQGVRIEQTIKSASQILAAYNEGPQ